MTTALSLLAVALSALALNRQRGTTERLDDHEDRFDAIVKEVARMIREEER